jgi:predicted RNase H-like HicB family nuclease
MRSASCAKRVQHQRQPDAGFAFQSVRKMRTSMPILGTRTPVAPATRRAIAPRRRLTRAPVAQGDRASAFQAEGRKFETSRGRQPSLANDRARATAGKPASLEISRVRQISGGGLTRRSSKGAKAGRPLCSWGWAASAPKALRRARPQPWRRRGPTRIKRGSRPPGRATFAKHSLRSWLRLASQPGLYAPTRGAAACPPKLRKSKERPPAHRSSEGARTASCPAWPSQKTRPAQPATRTTTMGTCRRKLSMSLDRLCRTDPYWPVNEGQGPAARPEITRVRRNQAKGLTSPRRMWRVRHHRARPRGRKSRAGPATPHRARPRTVPGQRMVEEVMNTYHVAYVRDASGWWVASVRHVRGCHTQGRTVDEARRRIRGALGLFVDDAESAKLVDHVRLPARAAKAVRDYASLRRKARAQDRRAIAAARKAVRILQRGRLKMSGRDAAELLGLSHQRVHQLAQQEAAATPS